MQGQAFSIGLSAFLDFISQRGPFVAAFASMIFVMIDVVAVRWRRTRPVAPKANRLLELLNSFGLMFGIVVATGLGLYSVNTRWMPKTPEVIWQEQITESLERCLARLEALPFERRQRLVEQLRMNFDSLDLQCLAMAIRDARHAEITVPADASVSDHLRVTMLHGLKLLEIPSANKILRAAFGIRRETFLGYGFSLPGDSSEPRAHEYLVKNQCSTSSRASGPCSQPNSGSREVFTWILSPSDVTPDETIGNILKRVPPEDSREDFASILAAIDSGRLAKSPPLLIRFSKFVISNYAGTIGRADASYVFFSNLAEMWDKSIPASETLSGRLPDPDAQGKPGLRVFIWLYYPSSADDGRLATWQNIFALLKSLKNFDPAISEPN